MRTANPEMIRAITDYLVSAYEQFLTIHQDDNDGEGVRFVDSFMGVHNFHKAIVLDLCDRLPRQAHLIRRVAVDTFAQGLGLTGDTL